MTDTDLLRHLAEKVLGLEEIDPATEHLSPRENYHVRNGRIVIASLDVGIEYLSPLEDANDALRMLEAMPTEKAGQILWTVGLKWETLGADHSPYTIKEFLRDLCLACAKATGWTE